MHHEYVERVVDLLDPAANRIYNMSADKARARVLDGTPKRRFQHGAVKVEKLRRRVPGAELELRKQFLAMYS